MIVKSFDVCSSCGRTHTIDKKSLSEGREYYSCSECRMWDKKSRSYVPFDFLSSMKRKLKNTELVNEIWKSIYDEVLSVGKNVEYVDCAPSSKLLKVEKLFDGIPSLDNKTLTTSKVLVDDKEYVWVSVHINE